MIFERCGLLAGLTVLTLVPAAPGQAPAPSGHVALDAKASGSKTFYFDGRAGNNQVSVFSQSTLEDFTVVCNKVSGKCQFDPKDLGALTGKFSIRVEDLRSGIDLRDHHLRTPDWLDAERCPEIVIQVDKIEDVKKTEADTATMTLVGKCTIRCKTNDVKLPCTVTYRDESPTTMKRVKGDLVRMRSEFDLKLSDYGVTGPPGSDTIGLKVSDKLAVKVSVFGATSEPPADLQTDKEAAAGAPPVPKPPERPKP